VFLVCTSVLFQVVDPEICLTKYRGKKKLVAAVTFLSDNSM